MAFNRDWLPHARMEQLSMARVWRSVLQTKAQVWLVTQEEMGQLVSHIGEAEVILPKLDSPDRTTVITAEANRVFGGLVTHMRYLKDRKFKSPPLVAEDYPALLLSPPDTTRTPRGDPRAQIAAEIRRYGTDMLILVYRYAEGTEHLADPHTDISKQVRWGLMRPTGEVKAAGEIAAPPASPLELPNVIDTRRRQDIFNFPTGSSGMTAWFCIRLHNGKSGYGPWCQPFSAVVP